MGETLLNILQLTINKKGYDKSVLPRLVEELKIGNYSLITRDMGCREYVKNLIEKGQLENAIEEMETIIKNDKRELIQPAKPMQSTNYHYSKTNEKTTISNPPSFEKQEITLTLIDYLVEAMLSYYKFPLDDPRVEAFIDNKLIEIFNGNNSWTLADGNTFGSEQLKNEMFNICIEDTLKRRKEQHAGILYRQNDIMGPIESYDHVTYLTLDYLENQDVVLSVINYNPSFSGHILGHITHQSIEKLKNIQLQKNLNKTY